tara:strand:+ start:239 stop:1798 length:1560 start_codon:yes stop_codon:yes gene_type:complete
MNNIDYPALNDYLLSINLNETFSDAMIGFEKESLRVNNSKISLSPHPKRLGSSLCNKYITTDFSEAQLELITPPSKGNKDSLRILEEIHHFVHSKIGDEIIWPLSIPPSLNSEADIPIAEFGSSHEGIFKHIYRKGLACRYGTAMQSISGFHFNYSLPDEIWSYFDYKDDHELMGIKTEIYFNMIRNIYQMNWLLIYLFGASPVIDQKLLKNQNDPFERIDSNSLLLANATSLRMSEYGYSNLNRNGIYIPINTLNDYANALRHATTTPDTRYKNFSENHIQLNENILQIEAEFYATARAKSNHSDIKRPSANLLRHGVDFIEIRSLDLNPFSPVGIKKEAINFLELFLIFSLSKDSGSISRENLDKINQNDLLVSKYGRDTNQKLNKNGTNISIKDWGIEILEMMLPYAELMDGGNLEYSNTLNMMKSHLNNPDETISARIIDSLALNKYSHLELGNHLGESYKKSFLTRNKKTNEFWETLQNEVKHSLNFQSELEELTLRGNISFDEFKEEYFQFSN